MDKREGEERELKNGGEIKILIGKKEKGYNSYWYFGYFIFILIILKR